MLISIQIIGYLASICIPLAFLPQTIKIIKTKQTKGISIESYSIYFIGVIAFLIFAILKKDIPMIICEAINGVLCTIILSFVIYNLIKKKEKNNDNFY